MHHYWGFMSYTPVSMERMHHYWGFMSIHEIRSTLGLGWGHNLWCNINIYKVSNLILEQCLLPAITFAQVIHQLLSTDSYWQHWPSHAPLHAEGRLSIILNNSIYAHTHTPFLFHSGVAEEFLSVTCSQPSMMLTQWQVFELVSHNSDLAATATLGHHQIMLLTVSRSFNSWLLFSGRNELTRRVSCITKIQ